MSGDALLSIGLNVNGERRETACRPAETLLSVLRDRLGLTGTKRGCNQGVCGACTVMVDGRTVRSCLTIAATCRDRRVETVEGLVEDNRLSGLQRALVETGAVQCGYCTPGFAVALTALLREHPAPDARQVREAMSGHLCRCSGYVKIVDAALNAAAGNASA